MIRRILAIVFVVALATAACAHEPVREERAETGDRPSGIVLVVADGAGTAYWSAAWLFSDSLAVSGFPVVGFLGPGNASSLDPESASSATAIAIGERTFQQAVGVGVDSLSRTTVLEAAKRAGWATGLVTTTSLTDATPAAFATHVPDRHMYERIARQIADASIDVLLGDGRRYFEGLSGADSVSPLARIRSEHRMVTSAVGLEEAVADPPDRLAGFFDIDSVADPAVREPTLAAMTRAALAVLGRDPEGFFLLVENEHTDHRGHDNAALETIAAEMLEVDRAVRAVLELRSERPGTLVVVLGDHETGGLSIVAESGSPAARWETIGHTLDLVPLFAIGPGAGRFAGILTNAEIGRRIFELLPDEQ